MKTLEQYYRDIADAEAALVEHRDELGKHFAKGYVLAQNLAKAHATLPEAPIDEAVRAYAAANNIPLNEEA